MKVLILGGTRFLGRALVDAALARGHEVSLFNRGSTNPNIYPDVEKLRGDRDGNLDVLKGRTWDAVVDTCGYVPRIVGASARLLADSVEHYTFISSISVYDESVHTTPDADESAPLATLKDETVEEVTGETYGGLKVLCEQAAENAMPGRVLNVRSGLIVGPHDPTDRFTYWPVKVWRNETVLAPPRDAALQIIDARDQAGWIIRMAEQRKAGVYNVTGPDDRLTYGEVLGTCREVVGDDAAAVIHADEAFLLENEIQPWMHLPLWLPTANAGLSQVNIDKALVDGLTFRPLKSIVQDTLDWFKEECGDEPLRGGSLPDERETELLAKL